MWIVFKNHDAVASFEDYQSAIDEMESLQELHPGCEYEISYIDDSMGYID